MKKEVEQVFWRYIGRWRIEEVFRYNKNVFGYENIRVRTINAMQKNSELLAYLKYDIHINA